MVFRKVKYADLVWMVQDFPLPSLASAKGDSPEAQCPFLGGQFAVVYGFGFGAGSQSSEIRYGDKWKSKINNDGTQPA